MTHVAVFSALIWLAGCLQAPASASLDEIIAQVDDGIELTSAGERLQDMRQADPGNPEILIQLARIEIKQANDGSATRSLAMPTSGLRPEALARAETLLEEAAELDPDYANTWVLYGHLAYLKREFERSKQMLERAHAIGTSNPWLHINLGDTLWAMANTGPPGQDDLVKQAESEYLEGLAMSTHANARSRANRNLAEIYTYLKDVSRLSKFSQAAIDSASGLKRAYALHHRAVLLFHADDVDGALASAREAMDVAEFPLGRKFLGFMLAVKAGTLYKAGKPVEGGELVAEARAIEPDLLELLEDEPYTTDRIPIIYALRGADIVRDFSGSIGGRILYGTASFGSPSDVEALLGWGADPNFRHQNGGTALHEAIFANNVAVVTLLLNRGANPDLRDGDGRTATEVAEYPRTGARAEIRSILLRHARAKQDEAQNEIRAQFIVPPRPAPALVPETPVPFTLGNRYRLKQTLDASDGSHAFEAGEELIYVSGCRAIDPSRRCLGFRAIDGKPTGLRLVSLPAVEIESRLGEWFEDLGLNVVR